MNSIKLNAKSRSFIRQFKDQFLKAEKKWKKKYSVEYSEFTNQEIQYIPNIEQYEPSILHSLHSFSKKKCSFHFSTPTKNIKVILISPIDKTNQEILSYMKLIFIWFNGIDSYANPSCSKNLEIYLSLSPSLKLIPNEKFIPLGKKDANTAFTYMCSERNVIHIFREEEWFKVLIHETFHNLDLDFSKYDHGFSDKYIRTIFPNMKNTKFYESYCEVWALIFHSLFYSLHSKKSFNQILNDELEFSMFQCAKILNHFNMKYSDFYSNNQTAILSRSKYSENTPILSYYFFKTIFLYHTNDFLKWCSIENSNSIRFSKLPIHYVDIYQKIGNLIIFLEEHYKSSSFLNAIKNQEKNFQKNKKTMKLNDIFHYRTMRMTIHDLHNANT